MTHDEISGKFNEGSALARKGDWDQAATLYEACLQAAQGPASPFNGDNLAQFVRSSAINLSQLRVRQRHFTAALDLVSLALKNRPTAYGTALALATQGAALCGAGNLAEGLPVITQALQAQPIHGALTAADLIIDLVDPVAPVICIPLSAIPYPVSVSTVVPDFSVRTSGLPGGVDLLAYAEQLVLGVMEQSRDREVLGDAYEHLGRIKKKYGSKEEARELFQKAREIGSTSGDPDRHLADLDREAEPRAGHKRGLWSRLFGSWSR